MAIKWNTSKFLPYAIGGACWFLLIGILQISCIVNIPFSIERLWVKPVSDGLVANLIGAIAFNVEGYQCEDKLIFVAPFYSDGEAENPQMKSLSSIVDIKSWKKIESDTISTTYIDNSYKYILLQTSDGVNLKVYKK